MLSCIAVPAAYICLERLLYSDLNIDIKAMLAGIKFVDKSQADKDLEEERKLLKKQKKKLKKVRHYLSHASYGLAHTSEA